MGPALNISIPTTSSVSPADGRPYTLYHISLQLPLRRHEVRKRYNDFVALHSALVSETLAPPPAPLPPKSWLRRTFNNPAQLERRRQGLERYLARIIDAADARWRSSAAWRDFLGLPGGSGSSTVINSNGSLSAATGSQRRRGSSAVTDANEWVDTHRQLKMQIQAARQQLEQRGAAGSAQVQHARSAEAKASLVRAATSLAQLDDGLRAIAAASSGGGDDGWGSRQTLGAGEIRRRKDLLAAARKEVEGLEGVLRSVAARAPPSQAGTASSSSVSTPAAATAAEKEGLWKGTSAANKPTGRVLGGPLKETERTREHDNAGVLQLQKQIMVEQEEDVLTLGKTVARLKDMGIMINEELTIQSEMLGIVEHDTDRVQGKIDVARNRIKKIN